MTNTTNHTGASPPLESASPAPKGTRRNLSSTMLAIAASLGIATLVFVLLIGASVLFLHRGGEADAAGLTVFLLMLLAIVITPICALAATVLAIIGGVLRVRAREPPKPR